MVNKNITKILNILRDKVSLENYIYEFVVNYYLSRQLKFNSFEEVLQKFSDNNIKERLKKAFEENSNQIEEFKYIKDLTHDEVIEIIEGLSAYIGTRGGSNTTINSISKLSFKLLNLKREDKLLDVGSGVGLTLMEASKISSVSGIEINTDNYIVSCILFDLFNLSTDEIIKNDALTYDLRGFNANKVFMNMPMGLKIREDRLKEVLNLKFDKSYYKNHIKSMDSSWIYALDVIENTEYEKFVMLVNGSPLYSDMYKSIRKMLVNEGKVESVIALPSNLLDYTSIPIYLIVFSHNNECVKFVDATNLYSEGNYRNIIKTNHIEKIISVLNKDSNISKTVKTKSLEQEDFTLDPLRYTIEEFPFKKSIELKDVVKSINRGYTIRKKDLDDIISLEPTNYKYLMLQNFKDGIIDGELPYLKELDETYEKYFLKDNCIVISRLSPFKIGSIGSLKKNILVNGNLFFLEVKEDKIDKDFLAAYLQSKIGLKEIEKYTKGIKMKTISIRDLEKVKIPKVSKEKQVEIGRKFTSLNDEFKCIKEREREIAEEKLTLFEKLK